MPLFLLSLVSRYNTQSKIFGLALRSSVLPFSGSADPRLCLWMRRSAIHRHSRGAEAHAELRIIATLVLLYNAALASII